ncbi:DUF317 domain-containing protein [Streptomyces shenzhenensis]|uniref:DUF317 domain-containing protein n=1 Tax=Streptomyces shenzhenensis TaxID=943815 RepID=UPI00287B8CAE|nr:DUF317 domain-containing protein [Streptomyces shenzhenensis]
MALPLRRGLVLAPGLRRQPLSAGVDPPRPGGDQPRQRTWAIGANRAAFGPIAWQITFDATTPVELLPTSTPNSSIPTWTTGTATGTGSSRTRSGPARPRFGDVDLRVRFHHRPLPSGMVPVRMPHLPPVWPPELPSGMRFFCWAEQGGPTGW